MHKHVSKWGFPSLGEHNKTRYCNKGHGPLVGDNLLINVEQKNGKRYERHRCATCQKERNRRRSGKTVKKVSPPPFGCI